MTRDQLEHAIRAACEVADDTELLIFGSQAILGEYPDAPPDLRASIEVDVQPKNVPDAVDLIDGALGELSLFHETHGFYVHGVSIEAAILPEGWDYRTVTVSDPRGTGGHIGHCLEAHDLAASKLAAFREKDRDFVRTLLAEGMVDSAVLVERILCLPLDQTRRKGMETWVRVTVEDLAE
jgi:uncharacterized nucleotidyltransferase DUF6036